MIDPLTASLIATAVNVGVQAISNKLSGNKQKKAGNMRAKETKRETYATILNDALQRNAEHEAHRLSKGANLAKRRSKGLQDTTDVVRGAFNI